MKTLRYETHTRYEDSGLWGVIGTTTVGDPLKHEEGSANLTDLGARIKAVAFAKAATINHSDLRVVLVGLFRPIQGGPDEEYQDVIWENGVWKDNLLSTSLQPTE